MLPLSTRVTAARTRRANIYIYIYKGREGGRDLFTGGTGLHLTRNPELRISCRQCVHAMNSIARPTPLQPHHLAFPSIKLRQEEIWRWMVFIARASAALRLEEGMMIVVGGLEIRIIRWKLRETRYFRRLQFSKGDDLILKRSYKKLFDYYLITEGILYIYFSFHLGEGFLWTRSMLPVRCQGASLSRLFSSSFFPPLPRHDASWAEHYVADERKEGPRGRSICLNHLSERSRSSSRHDLGSRCLSFRSPSSLSLCRWIDNDRSWAGRKYANRPDWIILWSRSYRPENIGVEPGRVKNFLVSTRFRENFLKDDHLTKIV